MRSDRPVAGELVMSRLSRMAAAAAAVLAVSLPLAGPAWADIVVQVDKSSQRMSVIVDGQQRYTWAVSTGVHGTPSGTFRPQSLSRNHHSALFNNAPMPYSIFYQGNFAIHGRPTCPNSAGEPRMAACASIRVMPPSFSV